MRALTEFAAICSCVKTSKIKTMARSSTSIGEIHPTGEFKEIAMADGVTSAVEIAYELENPVKGDIYEFLTSRLDD